MRLRADAPEKLLKQPKAVAALQEKPLKQPKAVAALQEKPLKQPKAVAALHDERGAAPLILLVAFIVVPLLELWIIARVGDVIGLAPTLALLLVVSVVGAWLVKREGRSAWLRFREALGTRVPAAEVVDGALVLVGGTLLLTPGFLTDAVGLVLVIPPSRALINRAVRSRVRGQFGLGPARGAPRRPAGAERHPTEPPVDVDVVDVRRQGDR